MSGEVGALEEAVDGPSSDDDVEVMATITVEIGVKGDGEIIYRWQVDGEPIGDVVLMDVLSGMYGEVLAR